MSEVDDLGTMILTDEEGKKAEFDFLGVIDFDKKEYIFLQPLEEAEEGVCFILQVVEDEENGESYISVDDDKLLEFLFDLF